MGNRAARQRAAAAREAKARSRRASGAIAWREAQPVDENRPASQRAERSEAVEPEALVVTHWFDSGEDGEPYSATIRLTGQRVGIRGKPTPRDFFAQQETVDRIVPGSGPLSITTWVYGLRPGEWTVSGSLVRPGAHGGQSGRVAEPLRRAVWSWRKWAVSTSPQSTAKTRWAPLAPLARIPAVIPGLYTALAVIGAVSGLSLQASILAGKHVSVGTSLTVSLLAIASGLIGAKVWYAVLHPGPWQQAFLRGWSVDGLLVVGAVVAVAALLAFNLPIGKFFDAGAPGLFFAVAIGRVGCFFAGCCAGRCTSSRWGVWSSDQKVGARRIPTQLLESAVGLAIGIAAALLLLLNAPLADGAIFVAAFAAYLVVRQALLRLRAESRQFSWRRSGAISAQGS